MQTIFFYDWNDDNNAHIWPGLIYSDNLGAYCRMDLSEDELADAEADDDLTEFNDDETRNRTLLTAGVLSLPEYQNKDYLYRVNVRKRETNGTDTPVFYSYADEGKTKFSIWDLGGYQIVGKAQTGEVLDAKYCTTDNIRWDAVTKRSAFYKDGLYYFFYSLNPALANQTLNNLTVIDSVSGAYYVFVHCTNGACSVANAKYKKRDGTDAPVIRHTNEIVALWAEVRVVDRLTFYERDANGNIKSTLFYRTTENFGSYWVWAKNLRKLYKPKIKDNTKAEDVLDAALKEPKNVWKTPKEFYTDWKPTEKIKKGKHGFIRAFARIFDKKYKDHVEKETMPVWWWCNTLRNWCTFKRVRHQRVELFVWNGINGWDPFIKIMMPEQKRDEVMAKYFYDVRRFTRGAYIHARINYNQMYYSYSSIKLYEDSKFSQYDENTFQTVKIGSTYLNNKGTRRYPFSVGIPPVMRLPSGELQLVYQMKLPGMSWMVEVMNRESIDFINSVCQAYFGNGEEKTIMADWKRFDYIKDIAEEHANKVVTDETSTLIYQPEINTIREDNEILNISFSIPRQYPETLNGGDESYVEEWSR